MSTNNETDEPRIEQPGQSPAPLHIKVSRPKKSETRYEFLLTLTDPDSGRSNPLRIGIKDTNFAIPHHAFWDSYYPLMFITRNGGPLFNTKFQRAIVRFEYDVSLPVVRYFRKRASDFGLDLEVVSECVEIGLDTQTSGEICLFGGGKDSRLVLGMLREFGMQPRVFSAKGVRYANDIAGALRCQTINFAMPSRIVPAMMMAPRHIFHGAGLGEVHETTPWHQYMDISTAFALGETTALLRSVGMETEFHTPVSSLPYNIIQRILAERFPELHAHQKSVDKNSVDLKTLHVALCHRYHEIDASEICVPWVFRKNVRQALSKYRKQGDGIFGYRGNYEIIFREMIGMLYQLSLRHENFVVRSETLWEERWIDYSHGYVNPNLDPAFPTLFREYCDELPVNMIDELPLSLRHIAEREAKQPLEGLVPPLSGSEAGQGVGIAET